MKLKMCFDDVSEYEKFNKMYQNYIQNGVEATKALDMTKEAFWPSKSLSEEARKIYDDYIFKFGLNPEDAYILASRKNDVKSEQSKVSESSEEKKTEAPVAKSWFEDWINPVAGMKDWMDTLRPFNKFFEDSFVKNFGTPCWIDFHNGEKKQSKEEKGHCNRHGQKECNSIAKPNKGIDIVNDEIKKVLGDIPKEEVNEKNTRVNIVKNDPDNYEYKINHSSPDGKSNFFCHKIFRKF